jgi:hypothetical protein
MTTARHHKGPHPDWIRALVVVFLEDIATALSNQNQFVAHSRGGGVCDRASQLPASAIDLTVAAD